MTMTETPAPATETSSLTHGETFVHTVPDSAPLQSYRLTPLLYEGTVVGVIVAGREVRDICSRCGIGYGHFLYNGSTDACYKCHGLAFGPATTEDDIVRRAHARKVAAEKRARKAAEEYAARQDTMAAWKAEHADLVAALEAHLPAYVEHDAEWHDTLGPGYREPARTFLGKLAVQVADTVLPLTARQAEAAEEALREHAERQAARDAEQAAAEAAGHWGEVGKRAEVDVIIRDLKSFDSQYGTRWLVTMTTEQGQTLKTWTSGAFVETASDLHNDPEVRVVRVKATPKEHGEYRDRPETTVTRVAVVG